MRVAKAKRLLMRRIRYRRRNMDSQHLDWGLARAKDRYLHAKIPGPCRYVFCKRGSVAVEHISGGLYVVELSEGQFL